ncbi:splicing factor, suppressor of white-apricot homolog isoform X2 [Microcaecilia unicolor]|uniref:Splicing factor, suppressor of white-apricot homolog n=1 Tax=Microcaecilia unicolor TaxID=1415580 RepID=A0A6P7ZE69_9AMPH|nr:splicing factor, suppressor of white-apricot homolog isoform X2 [Microcaecilia unicolor]
MYGGSRKSGKGERKTTASTEEAGGRKAELLVFGYACKVFRDDEKALFHEQGKHLIPWMGDRKIQIDRYDGRGHLHDLSDYDAEHTTWNRDYQLSEEEARIEALCDEERYLALHTDLLEEEARQEEEYKRLSEALAEDGAYNAVGFRYGSDYYDPSEPTEEEDSQREKETSEPENAEESEEPFIAPRGLYVPSDVELPPTAKMHAIIERTANFVSRQGAQFEIMLKAKQARNSQFDFLRFDHYLNPYYKLIQKAMKEGRYTVQSERKDTEKINPELSVEEDDEEDDDGNYLHPSLFASKKSSRLEEIMKPLKVVDPDHPLAALVRKAQSENMTTQQTDNVTIQASPVKYTTDSPVAAMYYSYYMLPDGTYCLAPPPPGIDVATYYSALPAGMTIQTTTGSAVPPPPGTSPPPPSTSTETSIALMPATTTTSSLAPVIAIIPPPPDIQPVIDKLAEYVARNGIKFETSVRAKNDPRFEFLQPWHEYNPYYEFKKQFFAQKESISNSSQESMPLTDNTTASTTDPPCADPFLTSADSQIVSPEGEDSSAVETSEVKKDSPANKGNSDGKLLKASFAPISFAIKAKETDMLPLEKNRVKLYDDSEEEEEGKADQDAASSTSHSNSAVTAPGPIIEEKKPQLTQEELEAKQAKQRLEDRLAAAAREKLAQASKESKEKQLQAERKRKAALFLQTLKSPLLDTETVRVEENTFNMEAVNSMTYTFEDILPPSDIIKPVESPSSKSKEPPREEEKEKKKKKHKKRSRSRSPSKHRSASKTKSRSHPKAKHSLPSAYRTVRRSRSRSRSPRRRVPSPESHREEKQREKSVPSAYRGSSMPGISKKRTRSRSPHEKKKRHSQSHSKSKPRLHTPSMSPSMQYENKNSVHSTSISPMESRESSQERSRGNSQEKDGQISSAIVSSVQSKITQDLMAKVRAMLAASKNMQTSAS